MGTKKRAAAKRVTKPATKKPAKAAKPSSSRSRAPVSPVPPPARQTEETARSAFSGLVRVRALQIGFYDNARVREGDVFDYDVDQFGKKGKLPKWVEVVDPSTARRISTGAEELRRKHDETLREKAGTAGAQEGAEGIEDTGGNPLDA